MIEVVALGFLLLREVLLFAALGLALSGLDDVFVDTVFVARRIACLGPRWSDDVANFGRAAEPGWMAILIPAWDEADVIGRMLAGLTRTLDYPNYQLFVGVYPNDPATRAAVDAVADTRIEIVTTTRPGPTTKADCLNHLWRAAEAFEARGIR